MTHQPLRLHTHTALNAVASVQVHTDRSESQCRVDGKLNLDSGGFVERLRLHFRLHLVV